MSNVSFRISSGLKDIIGRELITDDFIAVFELVKNSFDADASNVSVTFQNLQSTNPSIVIKDNGNGMDEDDILNKWLFVAYSAKKSDTDYRNQIKTDRIFAGAKGIGRFSCDRLGANLKLTTKKNGKTSISYRLSVDWERFEENPEEEFHTITADLIELDDSPFAQKESGTILEITELRSADWERKKLLRLRHSLEKLINPNQDNDSNNFSIEIIAPGEQAEDLVYLEKDPPEPWKVINGPVKNFIFETLEVKTTQINLEIDETREFLVTQLHDRGTLIYELIEHNPYPDDLSSISITLFNMDNSAKHTFTRRMGLPAVQFGSVFLYKNGFRIHPYGDPQNDSLGIDRRKQQGYNRYLGSRELLGRIEIHGENREFQETSSRDGGLIQNSAFESLLSLFFRYALPRLEKYVVDLRKFGKGFDELPEIKDANSAELRNITFDIIAGLTKSKNVVDLRYDSDVLNVLENRSSDSLNSLLGNLKRISAEQSDSKFYDEIAKAEKQITILQKAREEAEKEAEKERERVKLAEQETRESIEQAQIAEEQARQAQLEARAATEQATASEDEAQNLNTQNMFLKSVLSKDLEHVIELHHSIGQDAQTIEQFAANVLSIIVDEKKVLKPEMVQSVLERISLAARKIITVSRFATKANFQADIEEITIDLVTYVREYLLNVYEGFVLDPYQRRIDITFSYSKDVEFITSFKPLNISILLDNLISNSRKHKATKIEVNVVSCNDSILVISFRDDGKGIPKKNASHIFDIGFTTTDGSGLGLYHSYMIMSDMDSTITHNEESSDGAEFILTFNKQ